VVLLAVYDEDTIGHEFVGQYALPLSEMRVGFRCVPLKTAEGAPHDWSYLFVKVEIVAAGGAAAGSASALAAAAVPPPRTEGFLHKKGHMRRNWTRRFFQLDAKEGVLRYFKPGTAGKPGKVRGTIELAGLMVRRAPIFGEFFAVEARSGREYALRAETGEELDEWVLLLEGAAAAIEERGV